VDRQLRVTELVPKQPAMLAVLFLAGIAIVAGLEALYAWMPDIAAMSHDGRIAAFDLDSEGSLAVWFSSSTLAASALVAVLIYTIRRHRVDDYYGRYRIWLWAAAAWMLMSVDEAGSLHEGFKEMMTFLTGRRLFGDGSLWWVLPYTGILGYVGMRILLDMRESRSSVAALLATASCYATAVLAQLEILMPETGAKGVMLEEGAEMIGNLFLLLSMALFARHVILDAEGQLPARKARKKTADEMTEASEKPATERRRWFARSAKTSVDAATENTNGASATGSGKETATPSGRQSTVASTSDQAAASREYDEDVEALGGRAKRTKKGGRDLRFDEAEDSPPKAKLSKAQRKAERRRKQRERGAGLA